MKLKALQEGWDLLKNGEFGHLKTKIIIKFGSRKSIFTEIYKKNIWGSSESISGPGSEIKMAIAVIKNLPDIINTYKINSILDAPCGDFNYMKEINLDGVDYLGVDIVEEIVRKNNIKFENPRRRFEVLDVISNPLPKVDLIICRDFFIHLSFAEAKQAIKNFKSSGSTWLLTNTYPDIETNINIKTGSWRSINLALPPYNFPSSIHDLSEVSPLYQGRKFLSLFMLENL